MDSALRITKATMSEELTIESLAAELAEADKPEQPQAESDPEEAAQSEEVEAEGTEDAPEEGEDGQPAEEPPEDRVIEWTTASGETFKATEKELKDGYLRQQDYTVKAQTLAEDRRQAQAQIQQQAQMVAALSTDLGELQSLQKQLDAFGQVDWNTLQQEDPMQANNLMTRFLLLKQTLAEKQQGVQTKAQTLKAEQEAAFRTQSAEAFDYLQKRIPKFSAQTLNEMREQCLKVGYRPDELGAISHKLLIEDLWKARQWDALQGKKPEALNKVKNLPPPSKPTRQAQPASKAQEITRAINLKRNFSTAEFAQLLKSTR